MNEQNKSINGFSKLTKAAKIEWLCDTFFQTPAEARQVLQTFQQSDLELQRIIDGFSENTVSNFVLPFGIAPNMVVNGKTYCVPMAIEESSVVAAAAAAAKFWQTRGGFKVEIIGTEKIGQLHFSFQGDSNLLKDNFEKIKYLLLEDTAHLTQNMCNRGGGVLGMELLDFTDLEPNYYQIRVAFETCDSMGANFINSVLEQFGETLTAFCEKEWKIESEVIMAILSNYTPNCTVRASVECPIANLGTFEGDMSAAEFAEKFRKAVHIAYIDPYRATTHNKGIFNGIDAVVIATANDFRAIEAAGHTHAARSGQYRSLSECSIKDGVFRFWLEIPLALGTIGGLTKLHPLAKLSLAMLGNPTAKELMGIIAATGLAQNFAALRSLTTSGIQSGHMKMHLSNILNHFSANAQESEKATLHFNEHTVSVNAVREFLEAMR